MPWWAVFTPGQMPFLMAWVVSVPLVTGISVFLGFAVGESIGALGFFALVVAGAVLVPFHAKRRRRRVWIWTVAGVALVPIGLGQPLIHPWTLVAVLWLAEASPLKVVASSEDVHRRNEKALRDLRRMAQRLGALTSDAEALAQPEEIAKRGTDVRGLRDAMLGTPPSTDDSVIRLRSLFQASIHRLLQAGVKGEGLASYIGDHPDAALNQGGRPFRKIEKQTADLREEINLAAAYYDEGKARLEVVERARHRPAALALPLAENGDADEADDANDAGEDEPGSPAESLGPEAQADRIDVPHARRPRQTRARRRPRF